MNCYIKIALTAAFCLTLGGCGLTNPYEKWLDECQENPDRIRPSEVKSILCTVGTWKTDYEGTDVYFQFSSDGSVSSDSEIQKLATNSTFNVMSVSSKVVSLTIIGGGHLTYVDSNAEETYFVEELSSTSITVKGKEGGETLVLVPAPSEEFEAINASKEALLATMAAANMFAEAGYGTSSVSDGDGFVCRFAIFPEKCSIRFDIIEDGKLSHQTISISVDEAGNLQLGSPLTIGENTITGLELKGANVKMEGAEELKVARNNVSRANFLSGDYKTHKINLIDGVGDAVKYVVDEFMPHDEWEFIEFNERETRPLVFCPREGHEKDHYWYVFYDSFNEDNGPVVSSEFNDIIYMQKSQGTMPFDDWGVDISDEVEKDFPKFFKGYFDKDGLILVYLPEGEESYLWLLSPTTDFWIKSYHIDED